jgi:hypothetical protein
VKPGNADAQDKADQGYDPGAAAPRHPRPTFRSDISAVEKAAALVTSVFPDGTENPLRQFPSS